MLESLVGSLPCDVWCWPVLILAAVYVLGLVDILRQDPSANISKSRMIASRTVTFLLIGALLAVLCGKCYTTVAWILVIALLLLGLLLLGAVGLLYSVWNSVWGFQS